MAGPTGEYIFQNFAQQAKKLFGAQLRDIARKSRDWFRDMALAVTSADPKRVINNAGAFERVLKLSDQSVGKMYFFEYSDPKLKATLPYYDAFPLIFVVDIKPQKAREPSILGLNLHYLPPHMRAILMNALYETANNDKMDKSTKLDTTYATLKTASSLAYFKPCIKMYLLSHLRSPFISINPQYWDYALMLPLARFQKMDIWEVWQQSSEIIQGTLSRPMTSKQRKQHMARSR